MLSISRTDVQFIQIIPLSLTYQNSHSSSLREDPNFRSLAILLEPNSDVGSAFGLL